MDGDFVTLNPDAEFPKQGIRWYWTLTALFAGLAFVAIWFDTQIAHFNRFGNVPGDARRMLGVSELFGHGFGIVVVGFGIWFLARPKRHFIPRVVVCALWAGLVVQAVKFLVYRIRPGKILSEFPESGFDTWLGVFAGQGSLNWNYDLQAFPSGHTATAVGLAVGLCWLFPRSRPLFIALACLAGAQRISAGAHWMSDVLAGAAIAIMTAGAVTQNWGFGKWLGIWEARCTRRLLAKGVIAKSNSASIQPFPQNQELADKQSQAA